MARDVVYGVGKLRGVVELDGVGDLGGVVFCSGPHQPVVIGPQVGT